MTLHKTKPRGGKEERMVEKPAEKPCYEGRQHMFVECAVAEEKDPYKEIGLKLKVKWWFCAACGKIIRHNF